MTEQTPEPRPEQTPEQLLAVADKLADTIATLKRTCVAPQTPLLVALFLACWVSTAECIRVQAISAAVLVVPFVLAQLLIVRWYDGEWLQEHGRHVHKCGGFMYLILSEYVLGMRHRHIPAMAGIVFQHMPTFLALLCTSTVREAMYTIGLYGVVVYPLAETWWQFNEFLLHGCLIGFAAWIKEQLLHLIVQSESLLEVRGLVLDASIEQNRDQLDKLNASVRQKELLNDELFISLRRTQAEYKQMSNIATEAVTLMGEKQMRHRRPPQPDDSPGLRAKGRPPLPDDSPGLRAKGTT